MPNQVTDYADRQRDWRNIATSQFSLANNILITISTGYFVLIFDKSFLSKILIDPALDFDWTATIYVASLCFIFLSILYGIAVMFCRLYDFRISRHLTLTRQRIHKKYDGKSKLSHDNVGEISWTDRISQFWRILFVKIDYISKQDVDSYEKNASAFNERFTRLRRQADILGRASWRWTKMEVLFFLVSFLFYIFYAFKS